MKYLPYSGYKNSEVVWFGDVPDHWKVAGFKKYLNKIVDYRGKTPEKTDTGVFLVTARNIKNGKINYNLSQEFIADDDYENVMSRGKPKLGEVLFTTEAPLGEVACVDREDIALAQRIIKFNGKTGVVNNAYLKYLIMSGEFQQSLMMYATGSTALGIKAERLVYLRLLIPSENEQKQIATFLDHETQKIDNLIEKQQQLIKLLQEKRQAVIFHAVTKGLSPNAKMKDSEVEWVGKIPDHWEVKPAFSIVRETKNKNIGNKVKNVLSLSYGRIITRDVEKNFGLLPESFETYQIVKPGNIILRLTDLQNDKRSLRVGLADEKGIITSAYQCLQLNNRMGVKYGYYLLHNYDLWKVFYGMGSGVRQSMGFEDLRRMPLLLPPMIEQEQVVASLDKELNTFAGLIEKCSRAIELSKERRIALISAAVTGKIDVRNITMDKTDKITTKQDAITA